MEESPNVAMAVDFLSRMSNTLRPQKLLNIETREVETGVTAPYAILSYVWTQWEDRDALLDQLRLPMSRVNLRYVWADFWCINQKDQEEKSREVGNMAQYYKTALVGIILVPKWRGDFRSFAKEVSTSQ